MDNYNVLVEKSIALGNTSIQVLVVAYTGITNIKEFKEALVKAAELYDKSDDNDEAYDEYNHGYYVDAGSNKPFYYDQLAQYRNQFEEGKIMFAIT